MLTLTAAVFSSLLIVTGAAKMRRPAETSRAIASFGLPDNSAVGLLLGSVEIAIGSLVLLTFAPAALAAQGVLYLAFTVWVVLALRRAVPLASCGCLGRDDTPPYWGHLILDSVGAILSLLAAIGSVAPVGFESAVAGGAGVMVIAVGTFLGWLILGEGARLFGVRHS